MSSSLTIKVITPERLVHEGQASYVSLPGTDGVFGVLPRHAPMVSSLKDGIVTVRNGDTSTSITVAGAFVEIKNNVLNILADKASVG